jgi:phenylalanyl-tRNA synthetase beta chain
MNIKLLDSWIRDYLKTDSKPKEIAEKLSLTSVSIERMEPFGKDFAYDIEITTNRPDLASAVGLAREAAAVLPQFGIKATFTPPKTPKSVIAISTNREKQSPLKITNDPKLVTRLCAVVMDVKIGQSPKYIQDRLAASGIRSHNNLIDITNYIMRGLGHPTHVMDYDRIPNKSLTIRQSKKGEKITTLDDKEIILPGGDIVAVDDKGEIIDLLGVMGLSNSVVTNDTKRILFFVNNNEPHRIRQTSMTTGIRTEAAVLNEKGIDPELTYDAFLEGIRLFKEIADGKIVSEIIDVYPNKWTPTKVTVTEEKINDVIGITIPLKKSAEILEKLGFKTQIAGNKITTSVPSLRALDITIPEDLIEEIARVYGYHNLPSILPPVTIGEATRRENDAFFWEKRIKEAMKYWGYTEIYTYSMVGENMIDEGLEHTVKIQNPLTEDMVYMRRSLIPSMLQVVSENKNRETLQLFEIANVYKKNGKDLPAETRHIGVVIKKRNASYYEAKGLLEQLTRDLGIKKVTFKSVDRSNREVEVKIGSQKIGYIDVVDQDLIVIECNMEELLLHATLKKTFTPLAKYPPVIEDLAFIIDEDIPTGNIIELIEKQDPLVKDVTLLDRYENSRTFHILYQDKSKNLTTQEVGDIREKIIKAVTHTFQAKLK